MGIDLAGTRPARAGRGAAGIGAVLMLMLGIAGCSSGDGADKPRGTDLARACGGMFDRQMVKESRHSRVHVGESNGYEEVADHLADPKHRDFSWKYLCHVTAPDDETRDLVDLPVVWNSLPPDNGESVDFMTEGRARGDAQLDVLCREPRGKKGDPAHYETLNFYVVDSLPLSVNSRARLLISTAREVTDRMECGNEIAFPDPDRVAPPS